jgi:hypothetical protein
VAVLTAPKLGTERIAGAISSIYIEKIKFNIYFKNLFFFKGFSTEFQNWKKKENIGLRNREMLSNLSGDVSIKPRAFFVLSIFDDFVHFVNLF